MPELPEVQTVVNELHQAGAVGRRILGAEVHWPPTIATSGPERFGRQIADRVVADIRRRGKFIVFRLNRDWLLVHLRMTGRLYVTPARQSRLPHEHVVLHLSAGHHLRFHDTRKFGRFFLLDDPHPMLDRLGPEPLDKRFTAKALQQCLAKYNRMLKPLLLDQRVVAGLGNIYVDEALWAARLHPQQKSGTLDTEHIIALHRSIRRVLRQGIENRGTTLGRGKTGFQPPSGRWGANRHELKVFRREGEPCPRCRVPLRRMVVGQRSTFFCPRCQKTT